MKITAYYWIAGIALFLLAAYFLVFGLKIKDRVDSNGCSAEYDRYVIDNLGYRLDPDYNFGTWSYTEKNKKEAMVSVGVCLCKKYNTDPSEEMKNIVKAWCSEVTDCSPYWIQNITELCKDQLWPLFLGVSI
jgi:hypothetical protein